MKLVIDIPETSLYRDMYTAICENGYIYDEDNENIAKIIRKGIPLEDIKAEIEEEKLDVDLDIGNETIYNNAINDVLAILDKHIKENKQ